MNRHTLSLVYLLSNILIAPIYILMAFFPRSTLTRRVMASPWSVVGPACLSLGFGTVFIATDEEARTRYLPMLKNFYTSRGFETYYDVAKTAPGSLVMWLHVVGADAALARQVYLESQSLSLNPWILGLCILLIGNNGPLGYLGYLLLRWVSGHASPQA